MTEIIAAGVGLLVGIPIGMLFRPPVRRAAGRKESHELVERLRQAREELEQQCRVARAALAAELEGC